MFLVRIGDVVVWLDYHFLSEVILGRSDLLVTSGLERCVSCVRGGRGEHQSL